MAKIGQMHHNRFVYHRTMISLISLIFFSLPLVMTHPHKTSSAESKTISLPANFAIEPLVSGLTLPTDMDFLPEGDILVAEKGTGSDSNGTSNIYLIRNPLSNPSTHLVLTLETNPVSDSGVLGLILDPDFENNHYFYVWYPTRGTVGQNLYSGSSKYRLSRFALDLVTDTVDPASELILLDNIPRSYDHNGGGMLFDENGRLYLSTGDMWDGNWNSHVSQDLSSPNGKILRIEPTDNGYVIPSDNPFIGISGALPEIFALGLRNPFRMAKRPTDGQLFVGDVGFDTWEEINQLALGANYGWPIREGPCPRGERFPCLPADPSFTEPTFYYEHPEGTVCCEGGAVAGMAFYAGSQFPSSYHNKLFVADFNHQFIAAVDPNQALFSGPYFAENAGFLADIEYFNEELYILDLVAGTISRIYYAASDQPPTAQLTLTPTLGVAPLTVNISAAGTIHPSELPLTYQWSFGDGTPIVTSSKPSITHTYLSDGNYTAALRVIDSSGAKSNFATAQLTVYSGQLPQITLTNLTEPNRTLYHGGDQFLYQATPSTGTVGLDPTRPYTWDIKLYHNHHSHSILTADPVISGTLTIPTQNHGSVNLWYELSLTMHTDLGLEVEVSQLLMPEYTNVTLDSQPDLNLYLAVNGTRTRLPYTFVAIAGVEQTAQAQPIVFFEQNVYQFDTWSGQQSGNTELTFFSPPNHITYTAHYKYLRAAKVINLPLITK